MNVDKDMNRLQTAASVGVVLNFNFTTIYEYHGVNAFVSCLIPQYY